MKVSITLPSLFPELLERALEAIIENTSRVIDYEVIVVSPFEVRNPKVKWVREEIPAGNCAAHNLAYQNATGDYVVALSDDYLVQKQWLSIILSFVREREELFFPYVCGVHQADGLLGTAFGLYYPYFPFISRRSIEKIGGYFLPEYRAHFSDVDIAMRVWASGGRCEICFDSQVKSIPSREGTPEASHRSSAKDEDLSMFLRKWQGRFGINWDAKTIRDFNLDIPEGLFPSVVRNHSVSINQPRFRELVLAYYDGVGYKGHLDW